MARSLDEVFDALAAARRRELLVTLLDHGPREGDPVVVPESDGDAGALEHRVQMHHVHLPQLEDHGFIEWDRRNHEVVAGPNFEDIQPLLELLVDHADELPHDWP